MGAERKRQSVKRRAKSATAVVESSPALEAPPQGLAGALDEVKATVIALLASLAEKEKVLRERAGSSPVPGVHTGLADIAALRRWASRTLRSVEVLNAGQSGELPRLLDELGEFERIVGNGR